MKILPILAISMVLTCPGITMAQSGGPEFIPFRASSFLSFFERSYFVGEQAQVPELTVTGGSGFPTWKLEGDVPPGFRISGGSGNSVLFVAEFRQAGTFTFSVRVTDTAGRFAILGPITAVVGPYIDFSSGITLRSGIAGWPYAASFVLRAGNPIGDCMVTGTFPLTCTLTLSADGTWVVAINGTPTTPGSNSVLINVPTDAGLAGRRFFLTIDNVPATSLYFPIAPNSGPAGLAIVNPGATVATVIFSAYDATGSLFNSVLLKVSPGAQISGLTTDFFPTATNSVSGMTGWIEITSGSAGLQGFQVVGDFTTRVAGIGGAAMSRDQVLLASGRTAIAVANPGLAPAAVTLKAYDANGVEVGKPLERIIPAKGFYDSSIQDGITYGIGDLAAVRHVRITSSLGVAASALLLQTEERFDNAALVGADVGGAPSELNFPHVVSGSTGVANYITVVGVTNASAITQTVVMTFNNGSTTPLSFQVSIPAAGSFQRSLQELFSLPSTFQGGWLQVKGTAALAGFVSYTDVIAGGSDIVPVQTSGSSSLLFSHVAALAPWSTGIALLNPGPADTTVEVYALNPSGSVVGGPSTASTARFTLPARSKTARLLQELIPAVASREWDGGFVFVRTSNNTPIFGVELFFLRGGVAIANVPAGVLPAAASYAPPTTTPTVATTHRVEVIGAFTGPFSTLKLGDPVIVVVSITDAAGRIVPTAGPINIHIEAEVVLPTSGVTTFVNTTLAPVDGVARIRVLPPVTGNYRIFVVNTGVASSDTSFSVSETATLAIISGNNQSAPMGREVLLRVRLTSPSGVPLAGRPIRFSPSNPPAFLNTDINGEAEFRYVVAYLGQNSVTAYYFNIPVQQVSFTITGTQ